MLLTVTAEDDKIYTVEVKSCIRTAASTRHTIIEEGSNLMMAFPT